VLQLFRKSQQIVFSYRIEPGRKIYERLLKDGRKYELYDDTVVALDRNGKEIFRTQVEEPFHVRGPQYANSF